MAWFTNLFAAKTKPPIADGEEALTILVVSRARGIEVIVRATDKAINYTKLCDLIGKKAFRQLQTTADFRNFVTDYYNHYYNDDNCNILSYDEIASTIFKTYTGGSNATITGTYGPSWLLEYILLHRNTDIQKKVGHQACYLLQLSCDRYDDKYKIGKSKNIIERLQSTEYRNAYIYMVIRVFDEDDCERKLIQVFSNEFEQIKNDDEGSYGNEIFKGDINKMMDLFYTICMKYRPT